MESGNLGRHRPDKIISRWRFKPRSAPTKNLDVMRQVKEFLQEHQTGLELIAHRLLETKLWQGVKLERPLQEAMSS